MYTRNLSIEGIIKPMKFEQVRSFFALVMKDIGVVSFREYIQNYPIELHCFLDISVQLTEALGILVCCILKTTFCREFLHSNG